MSIKSENWVDIEDSSNPEIDEDMRLKIETNAEELVTMYIGGYYYVVNRDDMMAALENATNTGAL